MKYGRFKASFVPNNVNIFYRVLVAVVTIAVAVFYYNLGFILNLVGILNYLAGVFIPMMNISSRKMVPQHGDYDYRFTSEKWSIFIMFASLTIFVSLWVLLVLEYFYD